VRGAAGRRQGALAVFELVGQQLRLCQMRLQGRVGAPAGQAGLQGGAGRRVVAIHALQVGQQQPGGDGRCGLIGHQLGQPGLGAGAIALAQAHGAVHQGQPRRWRAGAGGFQRLPRLRGVAGA